MRRKVTVHESSARNVAAHLRAQMARTTGRKGNNIIEDVLIKSEVKTCERVVRGVCLNVGMVNCLCFIATGNTAKITFLFC